MHMIQKIVVKHSVKGYDSIKDALAYWLSKSPEERVEAVEHLRRQLHGSSGRLQRTTRIIQQAPR